MTVFLFVTASVALLVGLAGLVAGHRPWAAWYRKASRAAAGSR